MSPLTPAVVRLQAGQAVSALGDAVLATSAVVWIDRDIAAGKAWAAAAVSGIPAAVYLAVAVAGPLAGVAVDRFDRRAVMAAAEFARAGLAGALAALALMPEGRLPAAVWLGVLYAVVFLLAGAGQFTDPAKVAVIAALEPGDAGRARAAGLAEACKAAAVTIGPLIAVPLTLVAGIKAALAVDAATFTVSWLAVRSLPSAPRPARGRGGTLAEFRAGLCCFASSRPLTALLTVTVTCQLGAGALTGLNVIAVTGNLHGTARDYGAAEALTGAGYIVGAIAAARLVRLAGARAVTVGGLFAAAGLTAAYALARSVPEGPAAAGRVRGRDRAPRHQRRTAPDGRGAGGVPRPGHGDLPARQPGRRRHLGARLRLAGRHRAARLPRRRHRPGEPAAARRRRPHHRRRGPRGRGPPSRSRRPGQRDPPTTPLPRSRQQRKPTPEEKSQMTTTGHAALCRAATSPCSSFTAPNPVRVTPRGVTPGPRGKGKAGPATRSTART